MGSIRFVILEFSIIAALFGSLLTVLSLFCNVFIEPVLLLSPIVTSSFKLRFIILSSSVIELLKIPEIIFVLSPTFSI